MTQYKRGYFEIGIFHNKFEVNIGTLWRSAALLGASGIFTIGERYTRQASDTGNASAHIPLRHYASFDEFETNIPTGAEIIGIELGGKPLSKFCHPQQAVYLLGAEDYGLTPEILKKCGRVVSVESIEQISYNVAIAGTLVIYDRVFRKQQEG